MSFVNHVIEFCRVLASSVAGKGASTVFDLEGMAGFDEGEGEQAHEQEVYGALGIIGRPPAPEGDLFAEALTVRTGDGLLPFAFRDLRLHRAVNPSGTPTTPREGQVMFVGYGGAFVSHSLTDDPVGSKRANVTVIYVPHDFDANGVPQKAHAITIDPRPGSSSITIAHAGGVFFSLAEETGAGPGLVATVGDGSTVLRLAEGELTLQAERVLLKGNVYVGRAAEAGLPLQGGPISPPCPSLFVSPI